MNGDVKFKAGEILFLLKRKWETSSSKVWGFAFIRKQYFSSLVGLVEILIPFGTMETKFLVVRCSMSALRISSLCLESANMAFSSGHVTDGGSQFTSSEGRKLANWTICQTVSSSAFWRTPLVKTMKEFQAPKLFLHFFKYNFP